jgi:hypothetical protein
VRIGTEDEEERYDKVVYQDALVGNKFRDKIYWDGRFKERAKAYQASLDNFKAELIAGGVDPKQAQALKSEAIVNGSIASVQGKAAEAKERARAERADADGYAAWLEKQEAGNAAVLDELAGQEYAGMEAKIERMEQALNAKLTRQEGIGNSQVQHEREPICIAPAPTPKSWLSRLGLWFGIGFEAAKGAEDAANSTGIVTRSLDGGYVGVTAPRATRNLWELFGTRYSPPTISLAAAGGTLVRSAAKNGSVAFTFGVSFFVNAWDYTFGVRKEKNNLQSGVRCVDLGGYCARCCCRTSGGRGCCSRCSTFSRYNHNIDTRPCNNGDYCCRPVDIYRAWNRCRIGVA